MAANLGSNAVGLAVGGLGAVVLVAGSYMLYQGMRAPDPVAVPEQVAVVPEAEPVAAEVASEPQTPAAAFAPTLDIVRIEPDGAAVIAGLAAPGSKVHVLVDGVMLASAQADADGNFVVITTLDPAQSARVLTLNAVEDDGKVVASDMSAIIEPAPVVGQTSVEVAEVAPMVEPEPQAEPAPEPAAEVEPVPEPEPAPAVSSSSIEAAEMPEAEPVLEAAGEQALPQTGEATSVPLTQGEGLEQVEDAPAAQNDVSVEVVATDDAPMLEAETDPETSAPRVLIASGQGISVVQEAGSATVVSAQVTLDSITYDATGEVSIAGRGPGAGNVRVYLDNRPILSAMIAQNGQWRTALPEVESGVYTLRVDELNQDGSVASRVETPFLREDTEQLAAVAAEVSAGMETAPVQAITVQPGSTLWAIASAKYGDGVQYVRVFEANRDQIGNPDLIYPGQVFTLPDL